jgi:hypothetical protein
MSYESLLINTVNLIDLVRDKWGQESSRTVRNNVKCRIDYENRMVRDATGELNVSYAHLFFLPEESISLTTLVEFDDREHAILKITRPQDSVELHHVEVYVK